MLFQVWTQYQKVIDNAKVDENCNLPCAWKHAKMYANISRLVQNYAISVQLILGVRIQAADSCVTLWVKKGNPVRKETVRKETVRKETTDRKTHIQHAWPWEL